MSEIKDLAKEMPEPNHTFQLDITGSITRKRFLGEFSCMVATIREQGMAAKHEAALNGEYGPFIPEGIQRMHRMIAYLRYTLTDTPTFWKKADLGYALRDPNVVEEVYNQVLAFEEKWLKQIWGEDENEEPKKEG